MILRNILFYMRPNYKAIIDIDFIEIYKASSIKTILKCKILNVKHFMELFLDRRITTGTVLDIITLEAF